MVGLLEWAAALADRATVSESRDSNSDSPAAAERRSLRLLRIWDLAKGRSDNMMNRQRFETQVKRIKDLIGNLPSIFTITSSGK